MAVKYLDLLGKLIHILNHFKKKHPILKVDN
jgi:hypothetical protein